MHTVEHVLAAVAALRDRRRRRSRSTARSRRSWTAARRRSSTRCARPGIDASSAGSAQYLALRAPVRVVDGESVYEAHAVGRPRAGRDDRLSASADRAAAVRRYASRAESFARELAPARTFGFVREVDALRAAGLIKGASTAERRRARRRRGRREHAALARRVRATQGAGLRGRSRARRARACGRASSRTNRVTAERCRSCARCKQALSRESTGARNRRDHEGAAAPLSVPARGPDPRDRGREADRRHQERHDQRAVLSGAFPRASDHAGRADHRGDGAGRRHAAHGRRAAIRRPRSCTSRRSTT